MSAGKQRGLTLPPIVWAYIEALRQTGLYGENTSTVMRELIMEALRRALERHLVEKIKP